MQDACKGHTIDNEDTIITFIFSSTLSIYLNHICISVVISIQPWLASKYIKVFLRTFVAYKKSTTLLSIRTSVLNNISLDRGQNFPSLSLAMFHVTLTCNQGDLIKTTLPITRNTMLCLLILPVCSL